MFYSRWIAVSTTVLGMSFLVTLSCASQNRTAQTLAAPGAGSPSERSVERVQYTDDPLENGRRSFQTFCASCHGPEGRGDGPVAPVLTIPPPDLTMLRAEHEGTYPFQLVYDVIDGRDDVRAHGTREMPVWGNIWAEIDGEPVSPEVADIRIREIVEYIRSIQRDE